MILSPFPFLINFSLQYSAFAPTHHGFKPNAYPAKNLQSLTTNSGPPAIYLVGKNCFQIQKLGNQTW